MAHRCPVLFPAGRKTRRRNVFGVKMAVSLASLSMDDMPLTLATLEADSVELIVIHLTATDAMALRMTCSSLRLAIGEATWNGIANRAAARKLAALRDADSRALAEAEAESEKTHIEFAAEDARDRAAFRRMCTALTQECLEVVSSCFRLVSIGCIPSGTVSEPSLVPEFYSKVMPTGQVPDAEAEAAFLALDAKLSLLRTTEWWAAFAEGDRHAHGHDSIAAHLERLVPPCGLRAALDTIGAPAGGWQTVPILLRAAVTSAQYRAHRRTGSSHSSGRIHLQSLILGERGHCSEMPHGYKGGHLAQGLVALTEALQPRSAAARDAWATAAEAARVAADEKDRLEQAALQQRQREQEAKEEAERRAQEKLERECKAAGLAPPPKAASSNVDSDGYADWW